MPDKKPYSYAVVRVVPRVDRDEFVNAGVIVYSPANRFLGARVRMNEPRLKALWPSINGELIERHLQAISRVCKGEANAGPIARMPMGERFHWLTAPRSTMIQVSPVRTGISDDPEAVLQRLAEELVS
jgi:hypothetical protein